MRNRRQTLLHGSGCSCERCRFEERVTVLLLIAVVTCALAAWLFLAGST